jgi:sugar phosphate isomerase/epimerase
MKLGFSSNAFKKYSLDQCIPLISQIGYSAVEILCDVPHAYPPQHQDVAGIRTLLSRHNLEVSNLNTFTLYAIQDTYHPSWIDEVSEMRQFRLQHTINCIELASKLGCKNISTEAGGPFYEATNNKTVLKRRFIKEINVEI